MYRLPIIYCKHPGFCLPRQLIRLMLAMLLVLAQTLALPLTSSPSYAEEEDAVVLRLAVASNFRAAAEELGRIFTANTGISVQISSASTGVLTAQIRRGAPFDVLLAADQARPQSLVDDGSSPAPARCYAQGSLVLLGADSFSALADADNSVAIANPRSAPYGMAALAVLEREDFAGAKQRRLIQGSNVQQAMQFFISGGADLALVARSLSPSLGLPIPKEWHPPIEQYAVLNGRSEHLPQARAFLDYLQSSAAIDVLTRFGYDPCS
jgi:molybdate transport system substrate-binding protein